MQWTAIKDGIPSKRKKLMPANTWSLTMGCDLSDFLEVNKYLETVGSFALEEIVEMLGGKEKAKMMRQLLRKKPFHSKTLSGHGALSRSSCSREVENWV